MQPAAAAPARVRPSGRSTLRRAPRARVSVDPPPARPWAARYGRRLILTDILVTAWAAIGTHTVQFGAASTRVSRDPDSTVYISLTIALSVLWLVALHLGGTREASVVGHGPDEYKRIVRSTIVLFGLVAIASYVFALHLPRAYVLVMMPAGLVALLASRFIWRRWLHGRRMHGEYSSRVLVVGNVRTIRELLADLARAPLAGYRVIGVCTVPGADGPVDAAGVPLVDGVPVLGGLDEVAAVAERYGADTVAVTSTAAFGPSRVRALGWELEKTSIDLVLAPALTSIAGPRVHTKPVAGLPLIHVDRPTYRGANRLLKRVFDIVGASVLLALLTPVFVGLGLAVKLTDRGSVFFRQQRVGLNGRSFKMIKFRSMVPNAEALLPQLMLAERDAGNTVLFKQKNDPRVTRVGRMLRRFSLDELPQLFNVLKGDMSLVGPRPPLAAEVDGYGEEAKLRLLVRPGMTGLWQVSGRSDLSWEDTVRLDVYYVENWSITGDLLILWKTAKAVAAASGAY
ncbi:polyprenyl glycosylphosphotransferase [Nakamurella endophytica]|uniref:Polyprenyl glycosylphosphotransferase n=1 Tax=Nakamurella endophytica TaxID=1748367 RepID=A0A917SMN9_9ACTN|nr:polyprenyl glycosylphosphotransferase [Nakamurella endophytica]